MISRAIATIRSTFSCHPLQKARCGEALPWLPGSPAGGHERDVIAQGCLAHSPHIAALQDGHPLTPRLSHSSRIAGNPPDHRRLRQPENSSCSLTSTLRLSIPRLARPRLARPGLCITERPAQQRRSQQGSNDHARQPPLKTYPEELLPRRSPLRRRSGQPRHATSSDAKLQDSWRFSPPSQPPRPEPSTLPSTATRI